MSNDKKFDAAEWLRKAQEEQAPKAHSVPATQYSPSPVSTGDEVETVVRRIEESYTDITDGYENWLNLGFAFKEGFGEAGRGYFHRVSRFNPNYKYDETDKQYTACMKSTGSGVTIKSFFHVASNKGIDITHTKPQAPPTPTKVIARKSRETAEESPDTDPMHPDDQSDFHSGISEADRPDVGYNVSDADRPDVRSPLLEGNFSGARSDSDANDQSALEDATREDIPSTYTGTGQSDIRSDIPDPGLSDVPFSNIAGMITGGPSATTDTSQSGAQPASNEANRSDIPFSNIAEMITGGLSETNDTSQSIEARACTGADKSVVQTSPIDFKGSGGQSAKSVPGQSGSQSAHSAVMAAEADGGTEVLEDPRLVEPIFNTPRLPASVHQRVPEFLRECCDMFSEDIEKDVVLVSCLTVISACLPNIEGVYFDELYSPHLFTFIAAPAGSGKGKVKWARYLGAAIHFSLVEQSKIEKSEYERELEHYLNLSKVQREGMKHPVPPKRHMFFIPANCSASGFIQALADNHFHGMIFETEADTLATALKQEWGNFCDVLRKAFHHESTTMFRRKESEHTEVLDPHLAILLAGTPKQIHGIMPNVENGLFSRFLYYAFEDNSDFRNPFLSYRDVNYVEFFVNKGKRMMEYYDALMNRQNPIRFRFTAEQGELFTERFNVMYKRNRLLLDDDFNASSRRLGLITFRIAMVLSALRMPVVGPLPDVIECSDTDFDIAIQITFILEQHAIAVFRTLPDNMKKTIRLTFFLSLPVGFNRQGYQTTARELDIKDKTAQRYIHDFIEIGWLKHAHNWYSKVEFDPKKLFVN